MSQPETPVPDRTTLLAFLLFVLVSGGASVAIRFTYAELPPFWGAAGRFFLGSLFFWTYVLARRITLPSGRALSGAILFGVFGMGLSFLFIYWGLVTTPASLYQTIAALVPLLTLFLAAAQRLERIRPRGLLGASLTVVGIFVAVGGAPEGAIVWPRLIAIVLGAACLAQAGIMAKMLPGGNPFATNAIAMTAGWPILLVGSLLAGETWVIPTTPTTWVAFGYIVVFVTIVAFMAYLFVLRRWTATGASYGLVLIPLVTVVLANVLAGERITPLFLLGAALVVGGVYVGAIWRPRRAVAAAPNVKPS